MLGCHVRSGRAGTAKTAVVGLDAGPGVGLVYVFFSSFILTQTDVAPPVLISINISSDRRRIGCLPRYIHFDRLQKKFT